MGESSTHLSSLNIHQQLLKARVCEVRSIRYSLQEGQEVLHQCGCIVSNKLHRGDKGMSDGTYFHIVGLIGSQIIRIRRGLGG
jgi:hypothetical protein